MYMILKLDGIANIVVHLQSEIGNLICLREAAEKRTFLSSRKKFPPKNVATKLEGGGGNFIFVRLP